ncbi:MAG: sigma-54 dependent transcriptional regulator [Thermodesulfovibrionales bacterium]
MTNQPRILLVDDESFILDSLKEIMGGQFDITTAEKGNEAIDIFASAPFPLVISDLMLSDISGLDIITKIKAISPESQAIMISGQGTIDVAVEAMKRGAFDFVTKPFNSEHMIQLSLRAFKLYESLTENKRLKETIKNLSPSEFLGEHPSVKKLLDMVKTVAKTESTVLLEGESGTGKEIISRMIHKNSSRVAGPFVAVNCGALPDGLVESELFGHEKGAFTGAHERLIGRFERAQKGTLFLDEINTLPLTSQAKLLRVIEERYIERLGSEKSIDVNIRLVAASSQNLWDAVEKKMFREDLYYRLKVIDIKIAPLRERVNDIPLLALHFMKKHNNKTKSTATGFSSEALKAMLGYSWPGNVRELENAIEHALIIAKGQSIMPDDLPIFNHAPSYDKYSTLAEAERSIIVKALKDAGGNKYKAAKVLGIPRTSLYSKIKKFELT